MNDADTRRVLRYLAANLRARRVALGLTQEQLACRAAIDATFLQRLERGVVNVSVAVLVRLDGAMGGDDIGRLFAPAKMQPRRRGRPPAGGA